MYVVRNRSEKGLLVTEPENSYVSVAEFCIYSGLPYQEVTAFLD
ncbi:hypothetical protein [Paenimyroides ummariense]|nr:hypothetical protein [Paenimyroides ummariense]